MKHAIVASILMSLMPMLASGAGEEDALHAAGALDAGQLQAIQQVSRSVLGAKRGQVSDAEHIALRDEVKALSVSIDQALAPQAASVILLNKESAALSTSASRPGEERFATVRSRLSSLRERNRQATGQRRKDHADNIRTQDLVAKAGKLDAEVQAALAAPAAERVTKLRELGSRLQTKGQHEHMLERRAEADARRKDSGAEQSVAAPETPTISTIVKHR